MQILRVKTKNKNKEIAIFWVIGPIKYAKLEYELYKNWNIKVNYKIDVLDKIINFLKIKSIFSKDWVRDNDICLSLLLIKDYVRDQIDPIDNKDKKE